MRRPFIADALEAAALPDPGHAGGGTELDESSLAFTLNGEARVLPGPYSVALLLAHLALDTRKVAVERNREIVPRSLYGTTWLEGGDELEIVHFIGGG